MHRRTFLAAAAAASLACVLPAWAQTPATVELAGIKYPPTVQVAGSNLVLNGAGIRYKFVIKVYTAGLYMQTKASTADAVLGATGIKRMHVVMLREIDGNELGKLFTRGMQDNVSREQFSKFIPGMLQMADIFSTRRKLNAGDAFSVDYVPGTGTQVLVNGKPTGEVIKEPEFFNALLRIWLGNSPADHALKDALLGQAPVNNVSRNNQ